MKAATKSTTTQNVAIGGVSVASVITWAVGLWRSNWPDTVPWVPESDAQVIVGLTAILTPIASRIIAGLRDPAKRGSNRSGIMWVLLFMACLPLAGCGTLPGGALAGKTSYNVEFSDTTADQDTRYKMNIKAPAGVDLASVTGMTYDWKPGEGKITVSQDQTTDTTAQSEALVQSTAASMAAMAEVLKIIAPLAQSAVDAQVREGEIKADVVNTALEKLPPLTLRGATP